MTRLLISDLPVTWPALAKGASAPIDRCATRDCAFLPPLQNAKSSRVGAMRRLRISGASVATPQLGEAELRLAVDLLGVGSHFDADGVQEIHLRIAEIIGLWLAEQEAKEASPVAKALLSTGRNLLEASKVLSGHQTGERTSIEIQVTSETVRLLALDPTIGSTETATTLVANFHEHSAKIGHACLAAWADLAEGGGQMGRPVLGWYDDFTILLLEIAKTAGIKASIGKDRVTGARTGWLFQAAQALEPFLYRRMRSKSPEACGKRLERSMRRLRDLKRQKSSAG